MTAVEITSLSLTGIGLAFAAGLLSFVSPCVLPLLPVYLSFISGVGVDDLGRQHRRLFGTSLLFVAGFTVVFMLMGAGAGGIGRLLIQYRDGLMIAAGAALAIGWTPCVGYVLGAILSMAATSQSAVSGSLLLLVYSIGLGVPFVLAALAFDWVSARLGWVKRHYHAIQVTAGALLIVFGVLMMFGVLQVLSRWMPAFSPGGL
jgi:cytochrome c-type biogenesis protein